MDGFYFVKSLTGLNRDGNRKADDTIMVIQHLL
jgi:hypothetical protein